MQFKGHRVANSLIRLQEEPSEYLKKEKAKVKRGYAK
jgi:hypothetical protein